MLIASDVFTPNDTPSVTYVSRNDLNMEATLKSHLSLPKMIVSISGPSKSGKTVLINRVLNRDYVIPVIGSGITSADNLWERALQWMETPTTIASTRSSGINSSLSSAVEGSISVPLVAKGKLSGSGVLGNSTSQSLTTSRQDDGLVRIIREVANSEFVILIDDFHYIPIPIREEVGRQIKVAAENGVKIVTASVPHRADDVVRSNPELRGRVAAVDLGYWQTKHLEQIANLGFDALRMDLAPALIRRFTEEAIGSPQLMQTICLQLCNVIGEVSDANRDQRISVSDEQVAEVLKRTSVFSDFTKMLSALHDGPRTRGTERKQHDFKDGSTGDVYRSVLLAIHADPVKLSFSYDEIQGRVAYVCTSDVPAGSSVTNCLEQMTQISQNIQTAEVLAWDGDRLDIVDPYFAFFLRCSEKLSRLGK